MLLWGELNGILLWFPFESDDAEEEGDELEELEEEWAPSDCEDILDNSLLDIADKQNIFKPRVCFYFGKIVFCWLELIW